MCGGGSKKTAAPAAPTNMGYTYSPADNSNSQRQKAAIDPGAAKTSSYGSDLASGSMMPGDATNVR